MRSCSVLPSGAGLCFCRASRAGYLKTCDPASLVQTPVQLHIDPIRQDVDSTLQTLLRPGEGCSIRLCCSHPGTHLAYARSARLDGWHLDLHRGDERRKHFCCIDTAILEFRLRFVLLFRLAPLRRFLVPDPGKQDFLEKFRTCTH